MDLPELGGDLLRALPYELHRAWLVERVEEAISATSATPKLGARVVVVTGEPGSGKTVLAAQLATRWQSPGVILRTGSTDGALAADPKNVIVTLGLQLRDRFGPEIFGPPVAEVRGVAKADKVATGAAMAGVHIDTVRVSPFRRVLIEGDVHIGDLEGEAVAADVGELRDLVADLSLPLLAQEAMVDPLRRLAQLRPDTAVRIVIDGLDESPELTRALPIGSDGTANTTWILTSRPGRHLDRLAPAFGMSVERVDLDQPNALTLRIDDAERYTMARLADPAVGEALGRAGVARPVAELARALAVASDGNFLYLYHLLYGLAEDRIPSALTGDGAPPTGLDGIYRFLVIDGVRERAGTTWRTDHVPVLGILAVAQAPLTTADLARFAGVDPMTVDDVLADVEQFIERVSLPGDAAVALYHRSFGEFLVTQDRSRNPRPLEAATVYHRRIAEAFDEDANDHYALAHLPAHVAEMGDLDRLAALITGPFTRRQWEALGAANALATCAFGIRQTADAGRDDLLVQLLDRGGTLRDEVNEEWETGRFVVTLLDDGAAVRRRTARGSPKLPWSAFLAAERLLDLGEPAFALESLREAMRRPWPRFRPETPRSYGLAEDTILDWPDRPLVGFLTRVAATEPDLAFALVKRLYVDGPNTPNVQSAWRDVLRDSLTGAECPEVYRRLADVTVALLAKPLYPAGATGIADALLATIARAAPSAVTDPAWAADAALRACTVRLHMPSIFRGDSPYDGLSAAATGLLSVAAAVPETELAGLVNQGVLSLLDSVPTPEVPTESRYDRRSEHLGQFAWVLHQVGAADRAAAAEAALIACELDASNSDPPLGGVASGLAWLKQTAEDVRLRAAAIAARHGLVDRVAEATESIADPWRGEPDEVSLDAVQTAHTTYAAARVALALAADGAATNTQLASVMLQRQRIEQNDSSRLRDIALEGLTKVLATAAAPSAMEVITEVNDARSAPRREEMALSPARLRSRRWDSLSAQGCLGLLGEEISTLHHRSPAKPRIRAGYLLAAVDVDPALADSWLTDVIQPLKPANRGFMIVALVNRLRRAHPNRMKDLGVRWSDQVPQRGQHKPIANYELFLCGGWAGSPHLDGHVATALNRFATVLSSEFERAATAQGNRRWVIAGKVLRSASTVGDDQPLARAAAARLATAVRDLRSEADKDDDLALLSAFVDSAKAAVVPGPAADVCARLLADSRAAGSNRTDQPTIVAAAALLKGTHPQEARVVFDIATSRLGEDEHDPSDPFGAMLSALVTALAADRGPFRTLAERDDFALAAALAAWCTQQPSSVDDLHALQQRCITEVDDVDRRAALLAAVVPAWLDLGDLQRARSTAEVSAWHLLDEAGYFSRLSSLYQTATDDEIDLARLLVLDAVALSPDVEEDAAQSILSAWFGLRARQESGPRPSGLWFDPDRLYEIVRRVVPHLLHA